MLKSLYLKGVALVEEVEIPFKRGLNILTGETGSGKTALTEALALLLGERADLKMIRAGENRAVVEAAFDTDGLSSLHEFLRERSIPFETSEYLQIRREIVRVGKNRAYISGILTPLPVLQEVGKHLVEVVGQHSHLTLKNRETQLHYLDLFGGLEPLRRRFEERHHLQKRQMDELEAFEEAARSKEVQLDLIKHKLDEINALDLLDGEEDTLFEEHEKLILDQEMAEKLSSLSNLLNDDFSPLSREAAKIEDTPELGPLHDHLKSALTEINEASFLLSQIMDRVNVDPARLQAVETRLTSITDAKKKYGDTISEIRTYADELEAKVNHYESLDEKLEECRRKLDEMREECDALAADLSTSRQRAAFKLAGELETRIQKLNLEWAELTIEVIPTLRTALGQDRINFILAANPGETPTPISERISGGELARLYLALKILLADREDIPTLIFDEIDANIGGETATLVGEQLHALSEKRQIIAITHFPQVAKCGDHHLSVHKIEEEGRTKTTIGALDGDKRQDELLRMLGGQKFSS